MPHTHETGSTADAVDRGRRGAPTVERDGRHDATARLVAVPTQARGGVPRALVLRLQQQAGNAAVSRLVRLPERRDVAEPATAAAGESAETEAALVETPATATVDAQSAATAGAAPGGQGGPDAGADPGSGRPAPNAAVAPAVPAPPATVTADAPASSGPVGADATVTDVPASATVTTATVTEVPGPPATTGAAAGTAGPGGPAAPPGAGTEPVEAAGPPGGRPEAVTTSGQETRAGSTAVPPTATGADRAAVLPDQRPAPRPAPVTAPAGSASTVTSGAPAPVAEAAPALEAGPAATGGAAPSIDVGGGAGATDGGGGPPPPPPGLSDEELATLDGQAAGGIAEPQAGAGPSSSDGDVAPATGTPAPPGAVAGTGAQDVDDAETAEPEAGGPDAAAPDAAGHTAAQDAATADVAPAEVPGPDAGTPAPVEEPEASTGAPGPTATEQPPAPDGAGAGAAESVDVASAAGDEGAAAVPDAPETVDEAGSAPDVDASTAQEAVAAGAQAEVEEGSAPGPEPAESGGGGGGGAAVEDPPAAPPPDVSGAPPEQGLAQVAALRPTQMAATLAGVESAAGAAVAREQARLAGAPPRHTPLAGATQQAPASAQVPSGGAGSTARVRVVEPGAAHPSPQPRPLPTPGPAPVARVAPPPLPASPEGGLTEESARNLSATIDRLPVRDPGAALTPGPAPQLQLAGDADPGQVSAQQAQLAAGTAHAQAEGARDAAEPMGEDAVRPTVAVETLEADVGAGGAAGGAAGSAGPAAATAGGGGPGGDGAAGEDAAVDAVVEEQQGPALRAAAAAGSARMTAARQQHADQEQAQRAQSAQQVAALEAQHAEAEATQRADVRAEVTGQRTAWRAEQDALAAGAQAEARVVSADAGATVAGERVRAQTEAAQAHAQGQQEAAQARQEGEQEAARARASAKEESSGGFFGWLASKATALFDKVKAGISAAFEKARQAVKAAVEKAQALATAVIEKARQAVVAAIRLAGAALTAIGDRLLAAFPAVRERFRNAIRAAVQRAEAAVNRLAEGLKAGVRAALGLLGRALTALLDGLEAGLKAAVNAVAATVTAAINAAKAALAAIGAFLAVAKDVAANPGAWLRNLGAAVLDGIRNHLWKALKTAVQQWFNDKVEQVLGLGRAVWNLLTKGGISLAKIGAMAWEGLKAAIPPALIGLLVEKLVSMIVPAAGAVLAIVQGLQAAWGTVSRILQAIDKFITFLKAVKSGSGGPAFADVLAAAAITVVDFVSNWLLARLAKGASTVAGKIRDIARKIGAALKKVATKVGGALKKLGRKIGARLKGLRDRFRSWRDRRRARRGADKGTRTKADEQARKQQRLDRAVAAIKPAATQMLTKGVSPLRFRAALAYWRIRYRLTSLTLSGDGSIVATVNPTTTLDDPKGKQVPDAELAALLLPVFVKAEQQYREQLAAAPTANAQLEFDFARASAQGYADPRSPGSLEGLNRFQQADVLASQRPGSNKRQVERGVSIWTPTAAYDDWSPAAEGGAALIGFVDPSGGRYNPPPKIKRGKKLTDKLLEQLKTKREKGMTARLRREAAALGLTEADVAGALAGSRRSDVESLRSRMTPATTKAGAKKRESFIAKLHGQNVLSHSVETGRREGMRTTIAMGMTLLGMPRVDADGNPLLGPEGRPQTVASLHDVLQGRMAPMAPEGSASRAKKPEKRVLPRLEPIPATEPGGKPKRRKAKTQYATVPELAERQRLRAVGRIFATLLETAKGRPVLASPRGHDLKALATAIEMFLGARLRRHPSPDELAAAQALLQGELVAFLANFHGR